MSSEKKHKGGYELQKEKYAKLKAERDEWKAKYEQKCASAKLFENETTRLHGIIEEADKRIAFLLDYCPFWVRWMYRKHFEKGGN